jgi:tRNA1(Val) A37 N6-methylase TrmN6
MSEQHKSDFLSLGQTCTVLDISLSTLKNWLKTGKIKDDSADGSLKFTKQQIDSIISSRNSLKRRRAVANSRQSVRAQELYINYISKNSPNHIALSILVEDFSSTLTYIRALLCEAFLQLLIEAKKLETYVSSHYFKAYLEDRLDIGRYDWLIQELIDKTPKNSLLKSCRNLPEFELHYVPYEDTLGLIYLSLMELSARRQQGRYYTPQELTDTALETISIRSGRVFLDPCCGSGNFLLRLLKRGANVNDLYGCDLDSLSVSLARINFALAEDNLSEEFLCAHLLKADTLTSKNLPKCDVIVGNPPFGSCEDPAAIRRYAKSLEEAKKTRPYFADLFVERSLNLLDEGGIVQFVLPEAILNVASHDLIRTFISMHARVKSVRYLDEVFHAVQCQSVVLTLEKTSYSGAVGEVIVNTNDSTYIVRRDRSPLDFNFRITDQEAKVLSKMDDFEHCVKLRGHAQFALGIVTGSNNGMVHNTHNSGDEPVLRGVDIEPFKIGTPKSFVNVAKSSFQQMAPIEYYRNPVKIVYRFIAKYPIVALDRKGRLTLNSCNFLIPRFDNLSPVYLCAVLNSSAVRFYFERKFHTIKILRSLLEEVPIPLASPDEQLQIEFMVNDLMEASGSEAEKIKHQIDRKIAEIYGLGKRALKLISA